MKSKIWNSKRVFVTVLTAVVLGLLIFVGPTYAPEGVLNTAIIAAAAVGAAAVTGISLEDMKRAGREGLDEFNEVDKTASFLTALGAGLEVGADELIDTMGIERDVFNKVTLGLAKYLQDKFGR